MTEIPKSGIVRTTDGEGGLRSYSGGGGRVTESPGLPVPQPGAVGAGSPSWLVNDS